MLNFNRIKGFLMVEKGIGEVCADGYIGAIKRYVKDTKDEDIDKDKAVEYIMGFHKKHKSYSHIVNTSLSLERFSEYLEKPFKVGRPRKPKRIIRDFLSETEIARMFSFTTGIRQKAILAVLAYSGIRNNELCNLSIKDYDFSENMILVRGGKGVKDGKICVAQECTEIVLEYLKKYPKKEGDMLFESLYGGNLKTSAVRKHIKTIVKNAKITKRAYPHL